jgi:hypothetical protein
MQGKKESSFFEKKEAKTLSSESADARIREMPSIDSAQKLT